jgi:hypothetical protein
MKLTKQEKLDKLHNIMVMLNENYNELKKLSQQEEDKDLQDYADSWIISRLESVVDPNGIYGFASILQWEKRLKSKINN